jgi:hypothetical protein
MPGGIDLAFAHNGISEYRDDFLSHEIVPPPSSPAIIQSSTLVKELKRESERFVNTLAKLAFCKLCDVHSQKDQGIND